MTSKAILTLLIGVAALRVAAETDQSEYSIPDEQPIGTGDGQRRIETPEVVLHLKYESGELNRIYLAQFRKDKELWSPSVPARSDLCADLCHAGLGGRSCGSTCKDMLPIGLQSALATGNWSSSGAYGHPRVAVCPVLCQNDLGNPLCACEALQAPAAGNETARAVDWSSICSAFCVTDRYVLGGCPPCEDSRTTSSPIQLLTTSRVLDTNDGWVAWCNVQCRQGQGGAACNCDRSPFA